MTGIEVIPFSFEGKNYEIRVVRDGATIRIRAFSDDKPVNGYVYEVNTTTSFDLKKLIGFDAIKDLIHHRNPCPPDKVRVQWLCHLNDSFVTTSA